jgi:hypothetical protein
MKYIVVKIAELIAEKDWVIAGVERSQRDLYAIANQSSNLTEHESTIEKSKTAAKTLGRGPPAPKEA